MTVPMVNAIVASDHGPDIAYWLGRNKTEAKRILVLANPIKHALEIAAAVGVFYKFCGS